MRILPILTNQYKTLLSGKTNNRNDYFQCNRIALKPPLKADTVSFGRKAMNAEPLRALMAYGIPDMYSGKVVIDPRVLEHFYTRNLFSKSIKNIVKALIKYEDSLHTVERQFFSIVKNMARTNPQYKLKDVVLTLAPEHNKKLLEAQQPIFDELTEMAKEMPPEQFAEFYNLMSIVYKKLSHKPVRQPFSTKEFVYKLQRITDEIKQKNNPQEIDLMKRILVIAKKMPEKTPEEQASVMQIKSRARRNKKIKYHKSLVKARADALTDMEVIVAGSSLKNNQELMRLFAQTRSKIYNIPIVIPFNRKSFIYELQKITDKLEDTKLAHRIIQKATKLPTSHVNLSAFIMKCVEYSSDKIGYNMVAGSAGSIDHLIPFVKNGKDSLENYGISSAYYNSERAERSIEQQLIKFPKTYENCQKQVNRLIELSNNGTFKKIKLSPYYIVNFAKRMYDLSPHENRLILNLENLRLPGKNTDNFF